MNSTHMQGKICLVTGATNGIGQVAAQELARMGTTVVIVGRNPEKTAEAVHDIRAATGNQNVDSLLADLSSQAQIHELAAAFRSKYDRLDVLLNNAGGIFMDPQASPDGLSMTFAVNHLAYFLLTNLLLDMLKASAPSRIVNVSSDAHRGSSINFESISSPASAGFGAYGASKLANILFTIELARRLEGTGVTVNALHPGVVNTGFSRNNSGLMGKLAGMFFSLFGRSPEKGAETSVYLASSPEVANVTGKYFTDSKAVSPSAQASDRAVAEKLWDLSAELVHLPEAAAPL